MTTNVDASGIKAVPDALAWPLTAVHKGLIALARAQGWPVEDIGVLYPTDRSMDETVLNQQFEWAAYTLGLELETVRSTYSECETLVRNVGPGVLRLPRTGSDMRFLLILRSDKRWTYVLGIDLSVNRLPHHRVVDMIWSDFVEPRLDQIEDTLTAIGLDAHRRTQAMRLLLAGMIDRSVQRGGWILRLPPGAPLKHIAKDMHLPGTVVLLLTGYVVQLALSIVAWWLIGNSALKGEFSLYLLWAWALVLMSIIPFQLFTAHIQRRMMMQVGVIFKVRLLHGALQLWPEEIRHEGAGQFLGRVLSADMVEQTTLAGSLVTLLSVVQLLVAMLILSLGAGGWLLVALLNGWLLLLVVLMWRYHKANQIHGANHRAMTSDLVERMVGHRTRLAQEDPVGRHDDEDLVLNHYVRSQAQKDQAEHRLSLLPRAWMIIAVGSVIFLLGTPSLDATRFAVTLGGILLAFRAFGDVTSGVRSLLDVSNAWTQVKGVWGAATRSVDVGNPGGVGLGRSDPTAFVPMQIENTPAFLSAVAVDFRYSRRAQPVLQNSCLHIHQGDRILLTGPSGGGKSTLANLLAGLYTPDAGQVTLYGHTQRDIGIPEWRRRVVMVPQFHENYIFTGSLAFNLLMGHRWPPTSADMIEAEAICRELGLGSLLDRMPAGLEQMVGESGWRLSHGERSRIYIGRALLQKADLLILDESFGALDAESLQTTLACVQRRVHTMIVIAHP